MIIIFNKSESEFYHRPLRILDLSSESMHCPDVGKDLGSNGARDPVSNILLTYHYYHYLTG